jgi:pimeloyl-ACP methyl ester carboxylesterase
MQLYYKHYGNGFPFVILHGLYGSSDNWYSVARYLSSYYSVFVPDIRNHGHSPHEPEISFELMSDDIFQFFKEHHIEKAYLLGHSMGGKVAMLFACKHPELVEKLIIVDIAPKSYTSLLEPDDHILLHLNILQGLLSVDLNNKVSRNDIENFLSDYILDPKTRKFLLKNLVRNPDGSYHWLINIQAIKNNLPELMAEIAIPENAQISIPSLFIKGEKSNYLKTEDFEGIRRIFLCSSFVIIPGAGHSLHVEQQQLFLHEVMRFLNLDLL